MKKYIQHGFTLIEIMVVIVVIGILSAITMTTYNGAQQRAYNVGIISDAQAMEASLTNMALSGAGGVLSLSDMDNDGVDDGYFYSDAAIDANDAGSQIIKDLNQELDFEPTRGNIIDVVLTEDGKEFCIRVFNTNSDVWNNVFNAYQISSTKNVKVGTVTTDSASCDYINEPTIYSGGAIPGAYETVYLLDTVDKSYVLPTGATRIEVAVIAAGGNGALLCGGGGGGVSVAVITDPQPTYTAVVGSSDDAINNGTSTFGPVSATAGQDGVTNCPWPVAGGLGTTSGGVSQKYGSGGNGGAGGATNLVTRTNPESAMTGGGGYGGVCSLHAGSDGADGVYGGGGGGGGTCGFFNVGCYAPGQGGNPSGMDGIACDAATRAGSGGDGGVGGGGGGFGGVETEAVPGKGGSGMIRVLTCFSDTCNPITTPAP